MKRVISSSNGVEQVLHTDGADPFRGAIELRQDVDVVLREVRRAREQPVSKEFRKLAEVPMAIYMQACAEGWVNDEKRWKQWLNDPANRDFRVHGGRA